jgi:type I restriction enzyme R subunit
MKEDTFILDFVNDAEDIQAAFQPYYEKTLVGDRVDHKQLYELQAELDPYQVFCDAEVEEFCKVFFRSKKTLTRQAHGKLNAIIDPAVQRFRKLDDETQQEFRDATGCRPQKV